MRENRHNKAFKSDSQRLAVSLRSSIAKRRSHLNAALGQLGDYVWILSKNNFGLKSMKFAIEHPCLEAICCFVVWLIVITN